MSDSTIVVPLDGSAFAERALPRALTVARKLGTDVELLSVVSPELIPAVSEMTEERERAGLQRYHAQLIDRIAETPGQPQVTSTVVDGSVGDTLVRYLDRRAPALVVMATHGRGPISRFWIGSVADRVMREVASPVLLIRPEGDEPPSLHDEWNVDHILVTLDGSQLAEQSLAWANRIGGAFDTRYTLLRVVVHPTPVSPYLPHGIQDAREAVQRLEADAHTYLHDLVKRLDGFGRQVTPVGELGTGVAMTVLDYAQRHDVQLIVLATHGHGGLARMLIGSVADKVVRGSDRPVLVVQSRDSGNDGP